TRQGRRATVTGRGFAGAKKETEGACLVLQSIRKAPRRCWSWICQLFALVRTSMEALRSQSIARRHAWIILAAVLVFGYAVGVLGYVILTPEIGIRCVFAPVV